MSRPLIDRPGPSPSSPLIEFYKEEFLKHHRCLQQHKEFFSAQAIKNVEAALLRIISQVDKLSTKEDANQVVAELLREIDVVTKLSAWSDPHKVH
jgi:hypothetical protein